VVIDHTFVQRLLSQRNGEGRSSWKPQGLSPPHQYCPWTVSRHPVGKCVVPSWIVKEEPGYALLTLHWFTDIHLDNLHNCALYCTYQKDNIYLVQCQE
jgi:hypothetical protein